MEGVPICRMLFCESFQVNVPHQHVPDYQLLRHYDHFNLIIIIIIYLRSVLQCLSLPSD